jgi:hypothetical protein
MATAELQPFSRATTATLGRAKYMFTILAINFDGNMLTSFHGSDGGGDPTDTSQPSM